MTDPGNQRLFVGNLPNDTTEDDLKKLFKKFKVADVEIKRKKTLDAESVFAYVNISKKRVDECMNGLYGYKWKNQGLKIEVAKESFLDRLKNERLQREEGNTEKKSIPASLSLNNHVPKNKRIKFDLEDDSPLHNENGEETSPEKNISNENEELDLPRSRNLPMFRGISTTDDYQDIPETVTKKSPQKTSSIEKQKRKSGIENSMKRFEDFSSVWRDDTDENNFVFGNTDLSYDSYNGEKKSLKKQRRIETEKNHFEPERLKKSEPPQMKSKSVSEMKRRSALEKKWNSVKEKKNIIQNALKNIHVKKDMLHHDDVEITSPIQNGVPVLSDSNEKPASSHKKLTLFDDSADEDIPEPSFEVRPYLEGDKGLKRLSLKAKLANDERFRIDERFFDADETKPMTLNGGKNKSTPGSMKRYDPTQSIAERSVNQNERKLHKEKKLAEKNRNKVNKEEKTERLQLLKPEVSKEKHYTVSENLWEAFKEKDEKTSFSLSAMFDAQLNQNKRKGNEEEKSPSIFPQKKQKIVVNPLENIIPFEEENSEEDDERPLDILPVAVPPEKILGKCGVWGETFFFKPDDSRLKEAASFYKSSKLTEKEDFVTRRKHLRSIVKKKIQNSRRDKRVFKRKLGGKIDRAKFKMRLKRIHS